MYLYISNRFCLVVCFTQYQFLSNCNNLILDFTDPFGKCGCLPLSDVHSSIYPVKVVTNDKLYLFHQHIFLKYGPVSLPILQVDNAKPLLKKLPRTVKGPTVSENQTWLSGIFSPKVAHVLLKIAFRWQERLHSNKGKDTGEAPLIYKVTCQAMPVLL